MRTPDLLGFDRQLWQQPRKRVRRLLRIGLVNRLQSSASGEETFSVPCQAVRRLAAKAGRAWEPSWVALGADGSMALRPASEHEWFVTWLIRDLLRCYPDLHGLLRTNALSIAFTETNTELRLKFRWDPVRLPLRLILAAP